MKKKQIESFLARQMKDPKFRKKFIQDEKLFKQEVKYELRIEKLQKYILQLEGCLIDIYDLADGSYDGCCTVKSLCALIDEMKDLARSKKPLPTIKI